MISLLIVNFRTAALAREAVRTARATTAQPIEVVIVDNSLDPREASALRDVADKLVVSAENRGYAGGINAGRRECAGEVIVACNPDVTFAPRALDLLADALRDAAVAGPALFWDDAQQWRLPPGDLNTAPEKLDEILGSRSHEWRAQRDRRRFRKRVAFWSHEETTPVRMLSGAVLAIRAADFDEAGGFDERFALYFEESDFLRRLGAVRKRIVYVPSARVRHIYNQSAAQTDGAAARRYAESELRYLEKWNGPLLARILKRLERPAVTTVAVAQPWTGHATLNDSAVVVEASPLPSFATAAGCLSSGGNVAVPPEVLQSLRGEPLYVRVLRRDTAEVLVTYKITP
jgi:N-acetylglucosaminyl-diphospho-decaprenol L-rhamnosyltransferase